MTNTIMPLAGIQVVEFEGIGPAPLCGNILIGFGAEVTLITRAGHTGLIDMLTGGSENSLRAGKRIVALNLKDAADVEHALSLVAVADALIEGSRPGVMERLGLGPADCARRNPRLVYGRMTGWGQSGPLAQAAGHELNYAALSGMLSLAGVSDQKPIMPPTLADAAGALGLIFGIAAGVLQARASGKGSVVDAAILDMLSMLSGLARFLAASGNLGGPTPSPFHDSPFYDTYRCLDGGYITIAALEPQFYALLLDKLGLHDLQQQQYDVDAWPMAKERIATLFLSQPRQHWCELLEGSDACFAPVLNLKEAAEHPHNQARGNGGNGVSPRFSPLPQQ